MNIVVASCDAYSDCWKPMAELWKKFFLDGCHWKLYGTSNSLTWPSPFSTIQVGPDQQWCANLSRALEKIGDPFCLLLQEDFLPCDRPDWDYLNTCLGAMSSDTELGCIRVMPCPGADAADPSMISGVGLIGRDQRYRISAQSAIWRVSS